MKKTVFEKLEQDNLSYRNTFVTSPFPPLPEEVQGWNDGALELFCILSVAHMGEGMTVEEADQMALRQVKESDRFARWSTDS
jgi:hypothetical protein